MKIVDFFSFLTNNDDKTDEGLVAACFVSPPFNH